ncbi:Uncharacterised protein [Legionella sainthelensi]|nr:Uncharacterised protein [Legionella sainthelensi]
MTHRGIVDNQNEYNIRERHKKHLYALYVAFTLITGDDDIVNMAFHLALQYNFQGGYSVNISPRV